MLLIQYVGCCAHFAPCTRKIHNNYLSSTDINCTTHSSTLDDISPPLHACESSIWICAVENAHSLCWFSLAQESFSISIPPNVEFMQFIEIILVSLHFWYMRFLPTYNTEFRNEYFITIYNCGIFNELQSFHAPPILLSLCIRSGERKE